VQVPLWGRLKEGGRDPGPYPGCHPFLCESLAPAHALPFSITPESHLLPSICNTFPVASPIPLLCVPRGLSDSHLSYTSSGSLTYFHSLPHTPSCDGLFVSFSRSPNAMGTRAMDSSPLSLRVGLTVSASEKLTCGQQAALRPCPQGSLNRGKNSVQPSCLSPVFQLRVGAPGCGLCTGHV
jgi:hypothetical protein